MVGVSLHKITQPTSYELSSCGEAKQKSLKRPLSVLPVKTENCKQFHIRGQPKDMPPWESRDARTIVWLTAWFASPVWASHKPAGSREVTTDWLLHAQPSRSLNFSCCAGSAFIAMKSILIMPQVNGRQPAIWQMWGRGGFLVFSETVCIHTEWTGTIIYSFAPGFC